MEKYEEFFRYLSFGVEETVAAHRCLLDLDELEDKKKDKDFVTRINQAKAIFECDAMEAISESLQDDPDLAFKTMKLFVETKKKESDILPDFMALIHDDEE